MARHANGHGGTQLDPQAQVRAALHALKAAEALLEQHLTQPAAAQAGPEGAGEGLAADGAEMPESEQGALLRRLAGLPATARLTTEEAGAYLNLTPALLRSWRWLGTGPRAQGKGKLVRYTKKELDRFAQA
jgi:hypothetical protein